MDDMVLRAIALYVPVLATAGLVVWRRPCRRWAAGALLATLWNLSGLAVLGSLAIELGWWTFHAPGPQFFGLSIDLWLGWGLLWGAVPALAFRRSIWIAAIAVAWVDVAVMPLANPMVELRGGWVAGEAIGLLLCVIPGLLLARLTTDDRRLPLRTTMQAALFSGITFGLIPTAVLSWSGSNWQYLFDWPGYWLGIALQILAIPLAVSASAVQEFVKRGQGTPLPYDPPKRLVTTGPYAYIANPMQAGMTIALVILGLLLRSPWLIAGAFIGFAFSTGIADWHERSQLEERFGSKWVDYDSQVRSWIPRWKPVYMNRSQEAPVAHLYYAAFARALEHINLGWAVMGWSLRLPIINHMLQVFVDALGGGPRQIETRKASVPSASLM